MIAIVNGFNSADENESKAVTEKCEKAEAEKAEKKCSKSAGSAKTSI